MAEKQQAEPTVNVTIQKLGNATKFEKSKIAGAFISKPENVEEIMQVGKGTTKNILFQFSVIYW